MFWCVTSSDCWMVSRGISAVPIMVSQIKPLFHSSTTRPDSRWLISLQQQTKTHVRCFTQKERCKLCIRAAKRPQTTVLTLTFCVSCSYLCSVILSITKSLLPFFVFKRMFSVKTHKTVFSSPVRSESGPVVSFSCEAEGWQPSFSDRSISKRRQQAKCLPSSSAYSYSQSHSYSCMPQIGCQSSLMTLHSWDEEVRRMSRSVCMCVAICSNT